MFDEVQIWKASTKTSVSIDSLRNGLSAEEQLRAQRFRFEDDQKRFMVGRTMLRRVLGVLLGIDSEDIQFEYDHRGKPRLSGALRRSGWNFNISHSNCLVVLGVTRDREIGIDIECVTKPLPTIAALKPHLSAAECRELEALESSARVLAAYSCWTRKEAYVKACGDGLGLNLSEFQVSIDPYAPARFVSGVASNWSLASFWPEEGYVGAVAASRGGICTRMCDWNVYAQP